MSDEWTPATGIIYFNEFCLLLTNSPMLQKYVRWVFKQSKFATVINMSCSFIFTGLKAWKLRVDSTRLTTWDIIYLNIIPQMYCVIQLSKHEIRNIFQNIFHGIRYYDACGIMEWASRSSCFSPGILWHKVMKNSTATTLSSLGRLSERFTLYAKAIKIPATLR